CWRTSSATTCSAWREHWLAWLWRERSEHDFLSDATNREAEDSPVQRGGYSGTGAFDRNARSRGHDAPHRASLYRTGRTGFSRPCERAGQVVAGRHAPRRRTADRRDRSARGTAASACRTRLLAGSFLLESGLRDGGS